MFSTRSNGPQTSMVHVLCRGVVESSRGAPSLNFDAFVDTLLLDPMPDKGLEITQDPMW